MLNSQLTRHEMQVWQPGDVEELFDWDGTGFPITQRNRDERLGFRSVSLARLDNTTVVVAAVENTDFDIDCQCTTHAV